MNNSLSGGCLVPGKHSHDQRASSLLVAHTYMDVWKGGTCIYVCEEGSDIYIYGYEEGWHIHIWMSGRVAHIYVDVGGECLVLPFPGGKCLLSSKVGSA
jgi:hypothetical protein